MKYIVMCNKVILLLFLLIPIFSKAQQSDMYCKGFTVGFYDGYCYLKFPCYKPTLPDCPNIRHNDSIYYVDGYKVGFHKGRVKSVMSK